MIQETPTLARAVVWPEKVTHVPKQIFVREDVYREELTRIFYGAEWHPIAHASEIPNVGDFRTTALGEIPLLVTRDEEGEINVMYNSCSHRGAQVEVGSSGNKRRFECPYHRWSFSTRGELIGCSLKPGEAGSFSRANYPLAKPRIAIVHGLIFVSCSNEAPDIADYLGGYENKLLNAMGGTDSLKLLGYHRYVIHANWKTYHDNDGWHAPLLHAAFRMLNWQGGKGLQFANDRGHRGFESTLSPPTGQTFLSDPSLIEFKSADPERGSCSLHLFPLFSAVRHMDSIGLRFINPLSVDKTQLSFAYFGHEDDSEEMLQHRIRQSSNLLGPCGLVSIEDAAVFQRLHIGSFAPGDQIFQKGVVDDYTVPSEFDQNDEAVNILSWEHYRHVMGFSKAGEQ